MMKLLLNFWTRTLAFALTALIATGCTVARFEAVDHGQAIVAQADSEKVTTVDEDAIGANLVKTRSSQTIASLECNGISVEQYPKTHQDFNLNPIELSPQPPQLVLRFDNHKIIDFLDHPYNTARSLRFLSWAQTQRVNIDINLTYDYWVKTSPTNPELDCLITKLAAPGKNPDAVLVDNAHFMASADEKLLSTFGNQTNGYKLYCQKNSLTRISREPSPLTLAKINKALCGVATVFVE
jgi:hypothetical protein